MAAKHGHGRSLETILTFDDRDQLSDWSMVWSTGHIPGMDAGTGGRSQRRVVGRRHLRRAALTLGACLTMHTAVAASAVSGGFFTFLLILVPSVAALANPLRHFEVYLGQWSISGPGRAFRIIPMLDGIGIAMCINAIVRAICSCTVAAIAAIYVIHSISDNRLPFTYCRNFDLKPYDPVMKEVRVKQLRLSEPLYEERLGGTVSEWRNISQRKFKHKIKRLKGEFTLKVAMCQETYSGIYPVLYTPPAYNFFYVEVVQMRDDYSFREFNIRLIISIVVSWTVIWLIIISEKISHGRLIWNNMSMWFAYIPWVWSAILLITAATNYMETKKSFNAFFRLNEKDLLACACDAMEIAMFIHAASVGTELIHGKGLNHYASGHIDPNLNEENVWHSTILILLTTLNAGGTAICGFIELPPDMGGYAQMRESSMWILPLYSTCTAVGNYSHALSTTIFVGLTFSYMVTTFVFIKTALHIIFEYRVKLVFVEQFVVGGLILTCMALSMLFATNGGIMIMESIEAVMMGLSTPFICLLELVGMIHVYGSHDFQSDIRIATEENMCSTRIGIQWQIIPFIALVMFITKIILLTSMEIPTSFIIFALIPFVAVVLSVPIRACYNMFFFLRPSARRN